MPKKILLIEDDEAIRLAFTRKLSKWEVLRAETPEQIYIALSEVDLVVSDYDVPGVSFNETKRLCERKGVPLILCTGRSESIYFRQIHKLDAVKSLVPTVMSVIGL